MTTPNTFPGFDGAPTRERFPLYGIVKAGAVCRLQVLVRVRSGEHTRMEGLPRLLDQTFRNEKEAGPVLGALNLRVGQAIGTNN
jgi:hypothetical protein